MARSMLTVCSLGLIACLCLDVSDASLCEPNSKFKYDCNTCTCSNSGREFSCTNVICAPLVYKDKYLIEQNEKGYSILKPKPKQTGDGKKISNDNDLFVNDQPASGKFRRSFLKMPYRTPYQDNIIKDEDFLDNEDQVSSDSEEEIPVEDENKDYDDGNDEDDGFKEDLITYGRMVPQNKWY